MRHIFIFSLSSLFFTSLPFFNIAASEEIGEQKSLKPIVEWVKNQTIQMCSSERDEIHSPYYYNVAIGSIPVTSSDKKEQGIITYTAYFKADEFQQNPSKPLRPITFCFNGGPGSSSAWLHLGGLGPKKIEIPDISWKQESSVPIDSRFSILHDTDLVFIDPIGTGFSRVLEGYDEKKFYGIDEDIASLSEFIKIFLQEFQLWKSPKILLGESYGALRVTGLAAELLHKHFISCNGVVLISGILDFKGIENVQTSDFSAISPIPTYAATSHYFGKLTSEYQKMALGDFLREVENFCTQELAPALFIGSNLSELDKIRLSEKLHKYTNIPQDVIQKNNLRISTHLFAKTLFEQEGNTLGRFDSRYKGHAYIELQDDWIDPSLYAVAPFFASAIHDYFHTLLPQSDDKKGYILLNQAIQSWNWNRKNREPGLGYANTLFDIQTAISGNPHMKLFIASGIYDLALPYFGQELTMYRLSLPKEIHDNLMIRRYRGGHMMYLNPISSKKLLLDLRDFIQQCST